MNSEDSESSPTLCEMCGERKHILHLFPLHCDRNFCTACVARHVSTTIGKQRRIPAAENGKITCPGAGYADSLAVDTCRQFLPADVITVWSDILCESLVSCRTKVRCPYKNCWEVMVMVMVMESEGEVVEEAECPVCHRLFCVRYGVPWHSGIGCRVFLGLGGDGKKI